MLLNNKKVPEKKYFGIIFAVAVLFIFTASVYSSDETNDLDITTESQSPIVIITRLNEIITMFFKSFEEDGDVDYDHEFGDDGSLVKFVAEGRGLVGGIQDAVAKVSPYHRIFSSISRYAARATLDADAGQHIKMGSAYAVDQGYTASVGSMPNHNENGIINQSVSTRRDEGGSYYKAKIDVKTSGGRTVLDTSTSNSTTLIAVEGYSEITESIVIDRGGQNTGWWDF